MRQVAVLAAVAAVSVGFAGAAHAASYKMMTGPQGGSWYPLGGALKGVIEENVSGAQVQVLPGAGIANVKAIQAGKAQMAFANSVSTVDAINGKPPFEAKYDNVCNIGTLYPQYFQIVALKDAGVKSVADFKGKAVAFQPKGNTGEAITSHIVSVAGLSYDDMKVNFGSYTDSVSLMKDGNAVAFTLGTTVPASAIMDLAAAREIQMVAISDEELAGMQELNPGYRRAMIPAGSYPGQDEAVPTIGYATHVIAACDLDADIAYGVTKAMSENIPTFASIVKAMKGLTAEQMGADIGVPAHEGAARFYKEKGVM